MGYTPRRRGITGLLGWALAAVMACSVAMSALAFAPATALALNPPVWELPYSYQDDCQMMPGWEQWIDSGYYSYWRDPSWPDDYDGLAIVHDVRVEAQHPADGVKGDVVSLRKEMGESGDDLDYGWTLRGENYGSATIKVDFTGYNNQEYSYTFDVQVRPDPYYVEALYYDGSVNALAGSTKALSADGYQEFENSDRRRTVDDHDGLTIGWEIIRGADLATIAGEGTEAQLSFKPYTGDDQFWSENVQVRAILLDDGVEVAHYDDMVFTVSTTYVEIWPQVIDNFDVGRTAVLEPELRYYSVEYLDNDGYMNVEPKDGFHYLRNNGAVEVTPQDDGTFLLKRVAAHPGSVRFSCTWVPLQGDEVPVEDHLFLPGAGYWMDLALPKDTTGNEIDDVFSDGSLSLTLNKEGLRNAVYDLDIHVGVWTDHWVREFTEGNEYTVNDNVITLDGAKLCAADVDNVRVTAVAYYGDLDHELCWTDRWIEVREAREEYGQMRNVPGLVGGDGWIDKRYWLSVENTAFPNGVLDDEGNRIEDYEIASCTVTGERPSDGNTGHVVTLEPVEGDNPHWEWSNVGYGEADITATYTDIYGNPAAWSFTVHVGKEMYRLFVDTEDGVDRALPGRSLTVVANVRYDAEDGVPDPGEFAYSWSLREGDDQWASIKQDEKDPTKATVTFKPMPEDRNNLWKDVVPVCTVSANGQEKVRGEGWLTVANDFYALYPTRIDSNTAVGAWVSVTPELRHYALRFDNDFEPQQDVEYEWVGVEGHATVNEDVDKEGKTVFTLTRTDNSWFDAKLVSRWTDDGGREQQDNRTYSFDYVDPDAIVFKDVNYKTPHGADILWLAQAGISTGWDMKDGTYEFRGSKNVVRQDMAAFLYRLAGSPDYTPSAEDKKMFADVSEKTPHHNEIWWLAKNGISKGWTEGGKRYFRGDETVKRQDMAAFLRRLATYMHIDTTMPAGFGNPFADVVTTGSKATPHYEDILWLASSGVSTGWNEKNGTKTFRGMNNVLRQDMAAFLHRLYNLQDPGNDERR